MAADMIRDAALFARMQIPHENRAAGEAAVCAFLDEVERAREKHRIAGFVIAADVLWIEDGHAQRGIGSAARGVGPPRGRTRVGRPAAVRGAMD
jgi:hypothetical protein